MRDGELGDADGMGEVDIDQAVTVTSRRVLASWGAGGTVEVAPMLPCVSLALYLGSITSIYRFVDTSPRTHQVQFTKFPLRDFEHAVQLLPTSHIRLLEHCAG